MADTPAPVQLASAPEVGSVWGKAYDENAKQLYASAFLRRHADISPDGLGAIYRIDVSDTSSNSTVGNPVLWMDLNSTTHLGAGATLFPSETAANRGLGAPFAPSHDVWAFSRVGKQGLGGLELSDDYSTLYAVDLTNRQLLVIDVTGKTVVARHPVTDPGCVGGAGDVRPFGVDYLNGNVYVGVSCSGETSGNDAHTDAFVMQLTGNTFNTVVSDVKGYKWANAWNDEPYGDNSLSCGDTPVTGEIMPLVTNMQLDENSNMLIGTTNLNNFRFGANNYPPDESCTVLNAGHDSTGYIMHATPVGDGTWDLANNEIYDSGAFAHRYKDGQFVHRGSGTSHTFMSGLAMTSCAGQEVVVANLMDTLRDESAGTRYIRTVDALQEKAAFAGDTSLATSTASTYELYHGSGTTWENSSALGDIELLSSANNPAEQGSISGYIYFDVNGNDNYDTGTESGIGLVTVSLLNDTDGTTLASTSTAVDGSYRFSGINAALTYRLKVNILDIDLAGKKVGTTHPLTGITVVAGNTTTDQNFGFDLPAATSCSPVVTSIMPTGALGHGDNNQRVSVISFDYTTRGSMDSTPDPVELASAREVGTVWGKAYDAMEKKLYVSAFLRRHADLSPDGLGAIYSIDVTDVSSDATVGTPALWMDLNSKAHLGNSALLFPGESAGNRGLGGSKAPSHDVWAFNRVGKQGLGGLICQMTSAHYTLLT